jgi:hypothetical protein
VTVFLAASKYTGGSGKKFAQSELVGSGPRRVETKLARESTLESNFAASIRQKVAPLRWIIRLAVFALHRPGMRSESTEGRVLKCSMVLVPERRAAEAKLREHFNQQRPHSALADRTPQNVRGTAQAKG